MEPRMTHLIAYTFSTGRETGVGALDVRLPNGFSGPEVRRAVEDRIKEINPSFTQVAITNAVRYEVAS